MVKPSKSNETGSVYELREATLEDIDSIIAVERSAWFSTYPSEEAEITREDVVARFSPEFISQRKEEIGREIMEGHRYMIVTKDNITVGYSHGLKLEEYNDLVEVYVTELSQGIGKMLIRDLFNWFGDHKPIRLEVATYNKNAIDVYEHYGFRLREDLRQEDDESWNVLPSGKRIPVQFMEKPAD
ncbi:MAG TPA: GNAT family N-acetyltransferase [Candidatus Nitrosocosmicus sp.]|nr:GNAT family N-acetyltransferase [Candidatus Nitrosocosmicus sp.]